jgi:hypothetical protein
MNNTRAQSPTLNGVAAQILEMGAREDLDWNLERPSTNRTTPGPRHYAPFLHVNMLPFFPVLGFTRSRDLEIFPLLGISCHVIETAQRTRTEELAVENDIVGPWMT